jgi:alpha 1,3-glucosidase
MEKDSIHYGGWEHRDVHNINGMLFVNITSQAVKERTTPYKRPFVLTRSFYAGAQRYGAMWTGDNLGTWEHMAVGIPMVLSNSIAGMSFAGGLEFCHISSSKLTGFLQPTSEDSLAIPNPRC